jgi:hypothetical protein
MPLVPQTLNSALQEAFDKAMLVFAETIAKSPQGTNVANKARKAAAKTFASIATPAIDAYIRSATITVTGTNAPGQITLVPVPPAPAPVPLPTTTPGVVTGVGVVS